jgi:Tol biopolymer transport system component
MSWEPDNRHIVIANEEAGRGMHLLRADTDSGELDAITFGIDAETAPAVSPDGRRIAFTSGSLDFDILELFPQDGHTQPLLASSRSEQFPIWLNGTSRFAYITDMRGSPEIWLHDEGANWPTPILASGAEAMPKWLSLERPALSRDGTRIAYGAISRDRHAIWISPVAGGVPVPLDDPSVDQHGPAWSPDGNWLAYQRLSGTTWNLVKRPVGPGPPVVLGDSPAGGGSTVWSPNGEWIALSGPGGLRAVSPDGRRNTILGPRAAAAFDFTPDGRRIYAVRRRSDRSWELATIDVLTNAETVVRLDIPATAVVSALSSDSTGRRIAASVGTSKFDVWLLDGYRTATGWRRQWR